MITFEKFQLNNGLKVIVHQDKTTPLVAFNIVYNVGAKDENPEKTGFAHLFEHLMFGGSINIPSYDEPLERVGGSNNAFTNNDITNYYETLPKDNLETAFWLESDRMLSLAFTDKSLEVQRQVVIEEFKQNYLNQPYGDMSLLFRPLAYKTHPYQWSTIGKEISHIENATMDDVKSFFYSHYAPNNAILSVVGDVTVDEVKALAEKYFGPIDKRTLKTRTYAQEPQQTEYRKLVVHRDVPADALQMAFHMGGKNDIDYHATDLLSDVFSNGKSSRMYRALVQEQQLFSELDVYISGSHDPGLLMVNGKLMPNVSIDQAEEAVWQQFEELLLNGLKPNELQKVKNKIESTLVFSDMSILNKAMNLGLFELLGDANNINKEVEMYKSVSEKAFMDNAKKILRKENCSVLHYLKNETHG
ncbi:MAG: insulinase family protein [Bacteroidales bacterium]|nr:insulinase family protein [Bacteroidales bacterium]